jgi:GntR family transcriptional regulator/MocR family aminotransferase
MWQQLLPLSKQSEVTLQGQLRRAIARAVLDRQLAPGAALPSSRRLAELLKIGRNTVTSAYQLLVDDGYLIARSRTGFSVNPEALKNGAEAFNFDSSSYGGRPDWQRRMTGTLSHLPYVRKPANWRSARFPFVYGQFDPTLLPIAAWREASQMALRSPSVQEWAGDWVDADDPLLIEQIQQRILPRRGIWTSPDRILVTIGAQQAMYLLGAVLFTRAITVAVEQPGYPDIRNICSLFGARVAGIPVDEHGLRPMPRLRRCDYVFVSPSHQNPATVTMPLGRRIELLQMAAQHDFVLIEDDYDSELTFLGDATPALKALDRDDRVIYVGSLSKTLAPGLRLGFLVADRELIAELRAMRRMIIRHPPTNNQRTAAFFIGLGHYNGLVSRLVRAYRDRAEVVTQSLRTHLPEAMFRPPSGGSAMWVRVPDGVSIRQVAAKAAEKGLLFDSGHVFFDQAEPPDVFFRLAYSSIQRDAIEPGIRLLADVIRSLR